MIALANRWPRTSQPRGLARINKNNPLSDGLVFAAVPVGQTWLDMVSGTLLRRTAEIEYTPQSAAPLDFTRPGLMLKCPNGGHLESLSGLPIGQVVEGPHTTFLEGTAQNACGATSSGIVFGCANGVSSSGWWLGFDDATAANNGLTYMTNDSGLSTSLNNALGANFENFQHRVGWVYDGVNVNYYVRGGLHRTVVQDAPLLPVANQRAFLYARPNTNSLNGATSAASVILVWGRAQRAKQILELYRNPWQVFDRGGQTYFFGATVGGFKAHFARQRSGIIGAGVR